MSGTRPMSEPTILHSPSPESLGPSKIGPTALFLAGTGVLLCFAAVQFSDPFLSLGVLSIGTAIATAAGLVYFLRSQRGRRIADIEAVFDSVYSRSGDVAFWENGSGTVIRTNPALADWNTQLSSDQIDTILQRYFDDVSDVINLVSADCSANAGYSGSFEDRTGKKLQIDVAVLGGKDRIWVLREMDSAPVEEIPFGAQSLIPTFEIDKLGEVRAANDTNLDFGINVGDSLWKKLGGILQQGEFHRLGAETKSYRGYVLDGPGNVKTAIFVPADEEDITSATPDEFIDALPVALARVESHGTILHVNEAAKKLLGDEAKTGTNLKDLLEGLGRSMDERIRDMIQGRVHMRTEVARGYVNGHEIFLQVTLDRVVLNGEASILVVMNDATELKTLEAQFVQSQKMQAVGQLAGGVAHDFNNLLTAINGHCDLILMRHETTDPDYGDLIQIRHNANRAASLVGQLLAFSRKQTLLPKVIDLYDTLSDLNHLLNRLLGEKVTLRMDHAEDLPKVRVDERQLEQVIMNLVVNARDAMPNGGEVLIETKVAVFETDKKMDRVVVPFGTYVQIDVTDTGIGIPEDKIAKIFEPFWTTKGVGEGTGLGLSTAYGIIKQTGGFIFAKSEVGAGTTFTLYLPTHSDGLDAEETATTEKAIPKDLTGNGVVLLVEDEVPVRSFAARALNIRGYTVLEAGSAEEALEILEDADLHVDVFVSDVIMPGMDGPTWVRIAQQNRPDTRVVFVSGYAEDVFEDGQISVPHATFLPKPFSLNELTHTVKEQLESTLS